MQPDFCHLPDQFARQRFAHFPPQLAGAVRREWLRLRNRSMRAPDRRHGVLDDGREREANIWIRKLVEQFPKRALELGASEESLVQYAVERANEGERLRLHGATLEELERYCLAHGVPLPHGRDEEAIARRVSCSLWWRRNLRKVNARKAEALSISLGLVHRQRGLYSSDDAVHRRASQKRRNRALLDALLAINELGESFALSDLADRGTANPAIKRAELMTRIAGFEYIAQAMDLAGEFITITSPSRYHPRIATSGHRNPNYAPGTTPTDTRDYLGRVWSRITAALARAEIKIFGFRVAEPHHDGTPHFHGLFFLRPEHVPLFRRIVARYAVREDRAELGLSYADTQADAKTQARQLRAEGRAGSLEELMASVGWEGAFWERPPRWVWQAIKARVCFKAIDWSRGTAAGYIAKYIAKNIDGFKQTGESIGQDFEALGMAPTEDGDSSRPEETDASRTAARVDAWASTWGIRQFQQVGGPPVGVWRELRRWDYAAQDAEHVLMMAAAAADAGNWGRFVEVMGGWEASRKAMPLTLAKEQREPANRYGEEAQPAVYGVVEKETGQLAVSRMHEWKVCHGREADAWTRVNNSTDLIITPAAPVAPVVTDEQRVEWSRAADELERKLSILPEAGDRFLPPAEIVARRVQRQAAEREFVRQRAYISQFAAQAEQWAREAEQAAVAERAACTKRRASRALLDRIAAHSGKGIQQIELAGHPALSKRQPAQPRHQNKPSIADQLMRDVKRAAGVLTRIQDSPEWAIH